MINPFAIENKIILVTGATSGIGKATALLCSRMNARVIVIGRNKERLDNLMAELEGEGHLAYNFDLTQPEAWSSMISEIPEIDGIANCVGIANMNPFQFVSKDEMQRVMEVNYYAPVMLVNQLLKAKKLKKGSSVVFISSVDGPKIVHAGNGVYSASKSALVGMARNMAIDLASKKIRVNCVLPGTTNTPMVRTGSATEEMLAETAKQLPMKRFAEPEEIANAIIFLLSNAASYITGTELIVDGGTTVI